MSHIVLQTKKPAFGEELRATCERETKAPVASVGNDDANQSKGKGH
jgi:hypothetical protein